MDQFVHRQQKEQYEYQRTNSNNMLPPPPEMTSLSASTAPIWVAY